MGGGAGSGRGSDSLPVFCTPDESSEEEEDDEEDELDDEEDEAAGGFRLGARERALSPGLEESGLGLLARFAASALPSPTVGPSLSVVQLEAKQKARKKEERQSLMGKCQRMGCRELGTAAPSSRWGIRGLGKLGALPPGPAVSSAEGAGYGGCGLPLPVRGLHNCAVTFTVEANST